MFRYFILPFIWGYAEATFFFIIPDVVLGYNAIENLKKAMTSCIFAVLGALLGGITLYYLTRSSPEEILNALEAVPAISKNMILTVGRQIDEKGLWALFLGPLMAIPYKLYAAQAAIKQIDLAMFLAISVPARLLRFVLTTTGTKIVFTLLKGKLDKRKTIIIYFTLWIVFYAVFFTRMPS